MTENKLVLMCFVYLNYFDSKVYETRKKNFFVTHFNYKTLNMICISNAYI